MNSDWSHPIPNWLFVAFITILIIRVPQGTFDLIDTLGYMFGVLWDEFPNVMGALLGG